MMVAVVVSGHEVLEEMENLEPGFWQKIAYLRGGMWTLVFLFLSPRADSALICSSLSISSNGSVSELVLGRR